MFTHVWSTRRSFGAARHGLFFFLLLVLSSACVAGTPPTPTPELKGGSGEFRVALPAEPQSLNPDLRSDDAAFFVGQNLFNKLVTLDVDYRVIPDLAATWRVADDGLTYTFFLAKNVRWHDGQPLTSADVKWTFEAIANQKGITQDVAARIVSIETPDVTTVVMRLKEAWSPFLQSLAWYGTFILPKHIYADGDWSKNPANEKPVGSGAFKFVEWIKGERIVLAAHRDYFGRGPFLDQLTFRILKDPTSGIDLLLKAEVDLILSRPAADRIPELQRTPGIKLQTFAHPARYYFGFNLRRKPFEDVRVRQAINQAINRPVLVDRALLGYGAPALGFFTPAIPWAYNPSSRVPAFDLASAEKLLDQAGLTRGADGTRFKAAFLTFEFSPFKEIAETVREQLRAVGITVNVELLVQADWNKRVFEKPDFDFALTNGTWGPDPDSLSIRFGSQGRQQFMGYASAEFDAAVAEGARLTKLEERAAAYFRAQEILARDLPFAPLLENVLFVVARDNVSGLPLLEARGLVTFNDYRLVRVKR